MSRRFPERRCTRFRWVATAILAMCSADQLALAQPTANTAGRAASNVTAAAPRTNAWDRWEQRKTSKTGATSNANTAANFYSDAPASGRAAATANTDIRPMLNTDVGAPTASPSQPTAQVRGASSVASAFTPPISGSGWSTRGSSAMRVPGLSSPTSSQFLASFTTDYKTRPSWLECPPSICGPGINGQNLPIGQEDAYRASLPPHYMPTDLVMLPREKCYGDMILYLRREPAEALMRMMQDAERQGLHFEIFSAFRDTKHQNRLYGEASRRSGGRKPSTVARPGKSEHMLGTTIDLTNNSKSMMSKSFANTAEGKWLLKNARRYGFVHTCVRQVGKRTEIYEPWHIRYFGSEIDRARTNTSEPELETASAPAPAQKRGLLSKATGTITRPFRR